MQWQCCCCNMNMRLNTSMDLAANVFYINISKFLFDISDIGFSIILVEIIMQNFVNSERWG